MSQKSSGPGKPRMLEDWRFGELPPGVHVHAGSSVGTVVFRCQHDDVIVELTITDALILAAHLAVTARKHLTSQSDSSDVLRRFSIVRRVA